VVSSVLEEPASSVFVVEVSHSSVKFLTTFKTTSCHNCEDHCSELKLSSTVNSWIDSMYGIPAII
jgi:hypothetical protein